MQVYYTNTQTAVSAANTAQSIASVPVVIRKIHIGNPVNSGNVILFTENNAVANNTTQIAWKNTFTSTVSESSIRDFDFRTSSSTGGSVEEDGIFCPGGASIVTDQTMAVTVFYDLPEGN